MQNDSCDPSQPHQLPEAVKVRTEADLTPQLTTSFSSSILCIGCLPNVWVRGGQSQKNQTRPTTQYNTQPVPSVVVDATPGLDDSLVSIGASVTSRHHFSTTMHISIPESEEAVEIKVLEALPPAVTHARNVPVFADHQLGGSHRATCQICGL